MNDTELNKNNLLLNLIKKAYIRFKDSKIVQKIGALTVAGSLALTLSGCEITGLPEGPQTNIGGSQNNNNNNNNNNEQDRNPIDVSEHSKLLQNILLSEYYDNLIGSVTNENNVLEGWEFKPHPYAFYQSQGIDVEKIKSGETEAYTMTYVLDEEPNSLYMHTRVLVDDYYYQNYLLKYQITDKELDDYHLMHTGYGVYHYYIQSVFMNNEISKTRSPEIISTSKVKKETFEKLTISFQNTKLTATERCDIFLMDVDYRKGTFTIYVVPRIQNEGQMTIESDVAIVQCKGAISLDGDIYASPATLQQILTQGYEKIPSTVYLTQNAYLNLVTLRNFETNKK